MKSIHILLVEDNEGDIYLTQEALEEGKFINEITVKRDGQLAIEYFKEIIIDSSLELPDLVLLDINLPRKNGHEVLAFIKENKKTKHIPVIILTTSSSQIDINKAYNQHANSYIVKPVELDDFVNLISGIENFWFNIVKLPIKK